MSTRSTMTRKKGRPSKNSAKYIDGVFKEIKKKYNKEIKPDSDIIPDIISELAMEK